MRGGFGGRGVVRASLILLVAACAACGVAPGSTELPTFAGAAAEGAPKAGAAPDEGLVPNDCERLLTVSDLGALLGLPLDTVGVRTTIGVAEPSVGRLERVACRYTAKPGGPSPGRKLLDINSSAYISAEAASRQWRLNADVEDGDRKDMPIGIAGAVLVERGGETLLSIAYGAVTLTMVLPDQPLPGQRARAEALVDLALRVLPAVAPPPPPPGPAASTQSMPVQPSGAESEAPPQPAPPTVAAGPIDTP